MLTINNFFDGVSNCKGNERDSYIREQDKKARLTNKDTHVNYQQVY